MLALALLLAVQIGPASADEPNRQPQMATRGQSLAVVYGAGNSVYFASSADSGRTFGTPVIVWSKGRLALGMHRGPRVAYTPGAIVVTAIVAEQGRGRDGDLLAWQSRDGGRTWSEPVRVNDVPASAREGLHAMASDGGDTLFAAWLDLRQPGMRVYGASSKDGGATWAGNRLVYESPSGSVCQCCHPSVAMDASGAVYVMFRNALAGSRDLYLALSADGGRTFEPARKLGEGTWKLEACPMDGGGLALDRAGPPVTVWRREDTVFAAERGARERPLGKGRNPAAVTTPAGTYFAWTEGQEVRVQRPGGAPEAVSSEGGFPALAALADGSVVVAWESKHAIVVHTVR